LRHLPSKPMEVGLAADNSLGNVLKLKGKKCTYF
jgi:hypothetical protein